VETTARDDDELRRLVAAELEGIDSLARDIVAGDVQLF